MKQTHAEMPPQQIEYGSYKAYGIGFVLSLLLTVGTYFLAQSSLLSGWIMDATIGALASIQAFIQLLLFFNLTREPKPRWNLVVFLFMLLVVAIIVIGSLWIMNNLRYNLMPMSMPQ